MRRLYAIYFLLLWLTACSGAPAPESVSGLPTLAELPTLAASATAVPITPSATLTATLTVTASDTPTTTITVTPSATITDTPTATATITPTITDTPPPTADNEGLAALAALAAQATILPPALLPTLPPTAIPTTITVICAAPASGGFGLIVSSDPALNTALGCPLGGALSGSSAIQSFERGEMIWVQGPPASIYVLTNTGRYLRYDDTFNAAIDPASGGEVPPANLREPVRGFGKVWRTYPDVRTALGWALNDENGGSTIEQAFERGRIIYLAQRGTMLILIQDAGSLTGGTWRWSAGVP